MGALGNGFGAPIASLRKNLKACQTELEGARDKYAPFGWEDYEEG